MYGNAFKSSSSNKLLTTVEATHDNQLATTLAPFYSVRSVYQVNSFVLSQAEHQSLVSENESHNLDGFELSVFWPQVPKRQKDCENQMYFH
uniref:Uncharacterized protein n=1 Tax=Utricularia reniformis TaxID=192314 RepID=A0A1Y0B4K7_9LAMI|nr:hypothetical protein AEK19_MT2169 [Utricularia reniformis]ART32317.1 hypothetical protein AEK19_MT2169 [Utricularia reniformis]